MQRKKKQTAAERAHDFEHSGQRTNPLALNVQPSASAPATKSRSPLNVVSFEIALPQSAQQIDATAVRWSFI